MFSTVFWRSWVRARPGGRERDRGAKGVEGTWRAGPVFRRRWNRGRGDAPRRIPHRPDGLLHLELERDWSIEQPRQNPELLWSFFHAGEVGL